MSRKLEEGKTLYQQSVSLGVLIKSLITVFGKSVTEARCSGAGPSTVKRHSEAGKCQGSGDTCSRKQLADEAWAMPEEPQPTPHLCRAPYGAPYGAQATRV